MEINKIFSNILGSMVIYIFVAKTRIILSNNVKKKKPNENARECKEKFTNWFGCTVGFYCEGKLKLRKSINKVKVNLLLPVKYSRSHFQEEIPALYR